MFQEVDMPRRISSAIILLLLPLAFLLGGCATREEREAVFDNRLREMSGAQEAGLLTGMGRIPDNSYQLEDGSKVLQWRWDTSYIDPGHAATLPWPLRWLGIRLGRWDVDADGGFPPTLVRQGCASSSGRWSAVSAKGYRWQGAGCAKVSP